MPSAPRRADCRAAQGFRARRILVIEDDHDIAELIALHLTELPSEVSVASDGTSGLQLALQGSWGASRARRRLRRGSCRP